MALGLSLDLDSPGQQVPVEEFLDVRPQPAVRQARKAARRPRQRPVTNVVAMFVFITTFVPILIAYALTRNGSETAGSGK